MTTVRTRFAPSPTGYMHIGGMRTALFNWLWARHTGGKFILRIDDTDRQRNIEQAIAPILQAFRWLGLDWDEGPEVGGPFAPYFQSQRFELYREAADRLLAEGKAYRCYDTSEVIQANREAAEQAKRPYLNVRRSLELSETEIRGYQAEGRPSAIRFLVPRDETVVIDDAVRERVQWDCGLISDPVLVRSDGSPLYNFATVIDDAQMQITHVIRAEEHLSNTPIQVLLHRALGNALPQFAHIPYVAAPGSKAKLSKRKLDAYRHNPQFKEMFEKADRVFAQLGLAGQKNLDPVMVEYYEKMGYLPEAMLNALARLGWSLDDKTEIMSLDTIVKNFTLDRVVKSPAGFDPEKLYSFQAHWMNQLPLEKKVAGCAAFLSQARMIDAEPDDATRQFLQKLVTALGDRLKIFADILDYADFFLPDDQLPYDEKAFDKRIRNDRAATALLAKFRQRLEIAESFTADHLEQLLRDFVEAEGAKVGQLIHPLRIAVTGKTTGPGMFDCLELLGRQRVLGRIDRALVRV